MTTSGSKWHRYLRFWRTNVAADVDAELAFHVDARTQELRELGMEPAAARALALTEFGDLDRTRLTLKTMDEQHEAYERRASLAADLVRDARVAIRALRRQPALVAVIVITFALGIGMTSAIYSLVDAFLFRPLPGARASTLVVIGRTDADVAVPHDALSFPDFRDLRADSSVFTTLAAFTTRDVELNTDRGTDRLWIDEATTNYFTTLGIRPILGRSFAAGDDEGVLAHPYVVLTYKSWQRHFAGDSGVIGRVIRLNDHQMTVIGVMPPSFHGVRPIVDIDGVVCINQLWPADASTLEDRSSSSFSVFGLLRPDVSVTRARQAVHLIATRLAREYPTTNKNVDALLYEERYARPSVSVASMTPALAAVFMTLVVLVLMAACANVASLLLARVVARGRELAIRAAIGASQWRLVRQVMVECLILALLGGAGAVGVAYVAIRGVDSIRVATDIPMHWGVELDFRVVAFTIVATFAAALAAGIAPAFAARRGNLNELLKSSVGNSGSRRHQRLRSVLVAGQIAVSVVVLVSAGLFVRSTTKLTRMSLGFRSEHLLMLSTELRPQSYDSTQGQTLYRELLRQAASLPGVRSVALTRFVPFGYDRDNPVVVPVAAAVPVPSNGFSYFSDVIAGDYFATMGVPLLEGRTFNDRDSEHAPRVAIVNDALAKAIWPGQPAIGKHFHFGGPNGPLVEIVGVVRGMQDLIPGEAPKPYFFQPLAQAYRAQMTLVVQSDAEPSSLVAPLRGVLTRLDPRLPAFDVRSIDEHLRNGQAFLFTRLGSAFTMVFGLLALLLAMVGVYGVVSYSVAQRTREIGVRVALGASLTSILRLVVTQGVRLAWIGLAIGIVLSFATTGVLSSILYGVSPHDPAVLGSVVGVLTLIAAVASFAPARRATRIDPITSLRSD